MWLGLYRVEIDYVFASWWSLSTRLWDVLGKQDYFKTKKYESPIDDNERFEYLILR